jgi:hypothetical protein
MCKVARRKMDMLFVRGDGVILVRPRSDLLSSTLSLIPVVCTVGIASTDVMILTITWSSSQKACWTNFAALYPILYVVALQIGIEHYKSNDAYEYPSTTGRVEWRKI